MTGITCPVLFIRGEAGLGAVMTDDEVSWLLGNCSTASCAQIRDVGHLLHLQDKGQVKTNIFPWENNQVLQTQCQRDL